MPAQLRVPYTQGWLPLSKCGTSCPGVATTLLKHQNLITQVTRNDSLPSISFLSIFPSLVSCNLFTFPRWQISCKKVLYLIAYSRWQPRLWLSPSCVSICEGYFLSFLSANNRPEGLQILSLFVLLLLEPWWKWPGHLQHWTEPLLDVQSLKLQGEEHVWSLE